MLHAGKALIVSALLAGLAMMAIGADGDALSEQKKAQNKLLAYRAARADAIRKLAERIKGLHITSETTVKDFVAESDAIGTAMTAYLSGMKEVGEPKYKEDGTCDLTMEVTIQEIITTLKQIRNRYYKGDKFKVNDIDQMTVTNEIKVIREVGTGAPRPEIQDNGELSPITKDAPAEDSSHVLGPAKKFWTDHCMPQGRLMAVRAAELDAMRRLAERVKGLVISSKTTVKDFVAESDQVKTEMSTFIKGQRTVGIRYHKDDLIVEVDMEMPLRDIYVSLKQWGDAHYKGDKAVIKKIEEMTAAVKDSVVRETGMGVPPEKYLKEPTPEIKAVVKVAEKAPLWATQSLAASGDSTFDVKVSAADAAKQGAIRAAECDARQRLNVQVNDLRITDKTTVRAFSKTNKGIEDDLLTVEQGAIRVAGTPRVLDDGTVIVTIEIELKPVWNSIVYYVRKNSVTIE
ncbi:MAG: hypothetical protein ACE15C_14155 [Phycisphaerae bacterium]